MYTPNLSLTSSTMFLGLNFHKKAMYLFFKQSPINPTGDLSMSFLLIINCTRMFPYKFSDHPTLCIHYSHHKDSPRISIVHTSHNEQTWT